jgi:hypothetical protein
VFKPLQAGTLIDERYRIQGPLGQGGMGEVFRAHDLGRDVEVALKLLPLECADDPELIERFRREAEIAARLGVGGGIARVHSFGSFGGQPYCVQELVAGGDLHSALKQGLSRERVLEVVEKVASTLARCHAEDIVHRDIKPHNVLLDEAGRPQLCDFGLALDLHTQRRLTQSQDLLGTPAYMAPEQAASSQVGPAADVYSLGVILYQGLSGRLPFEGPPIQILAALTSQEPRRLSSIAEVSSDLERVCQRAMAKDPEQRYTASELSDALRRVREGLPLEAGARSGVGLRVAALVGVAAILVASALGLSAFSQARARAELQGALSDAAALSSMAVIGLEEAAPANALAARRALELLRNHSASEAENAEARDRLEAWELVAAQKATPQEVGLPPLGEVRTRGPYFVLAAAFVLWQRPEFVDALRLIREASTRLPRLSRRLALHVLRDQYLTELRGAHQTSDRSLKSLFRSFRSHAEDLGLGEEDLRAWAVPKSKLLAELTPAWTEQIKKVKPRKGNSLPVELERLHLVLGSPCPIGLPSRLQEVLRGWAQAWIGWAGRDPEQVATACRLLNELASLDLRRWRDPEGTGGMLGAVLQRYVLNKRLEIPFPVVRVTLRRGLPRGTWRPAGLSLVSRLKRGDKTFLEGRLADRPRSRAIAYWLYKITSHEARRLGTGISVSERVAAEARDPDVVADPLHLEYLGARAAAIRWAHRAVDSQRADLAPDFRAEALGYLAGTVLDPPRVPSPQQALSALRLLRRARLLIRTDPQLLEDLIKQESELRWRTEGWDQERDEAARRWGLDRLDELHPEPMAKFERAEVVKARAEIRLHFAFLALNSGRTDLALERAREALRLAGDVPADVRWDLHSVVLQAQRGRGRVRQGLDALPLSLQVGLKASRHFALEYLQCLSAVASKADALAAAEQALGYRPKDTELQDIVEDWRRELSPKVDGE